MKKLYKKLENFVLTIWIIPATDFEPSNFGPSTIKKYYY